MEKSYKVLNGTNGFESKFTQMYLEEQHLQIRHIDESGMEFKFEVQPSGWKENGKTLEGNSEGHTIRLWVDPDNNTHVFISPEKREVTKVKKLW